MRRATLISLAALLLSVGLAACGDSDGDPTDVLFGETEAQVPIPGTERAGVLVASDDGPDDRRCCSAMMDA